jgi:serine/threonine-protein kinase
MATCPKCGTTYGPNVRICAQDGTVLSAEPAQDAHVGQVLDGKYRLDTFLSHGGMGSVYRATHVMLDKTVAVKLIKPELVTSPDVVRRFQREARAASNLNHPNIVGVYDLGQAEDGTLYIAMEYINGPSLKDVIKTTGPMAPARIVRILRQVASALALAHKHSIIHRDLKPHNIMLARSTDGQEVAKLLDFGIAKTFDDAATQLTVTGFALGTPQYMAPEQAAGSEVDGRTDLYSMGVILYEMLIGEVPFSDPSAPAILVKQMTEAPMPPSQRRPGVAVSPALEAIALRCLEKEPAKRFDSAEVFSDALGRVDVGVEVTGSTEAPTVLVPAALPNATTKISVPAGSATTAATTVPGVAAPQTSATVPLATVSAAATTAAAKTAVPTTAAASPSAATTPAVPVPSSPTVAAPVPPAAVPAQSVATVSQGTHPTVPAAAGQVPPAATPSSRSGGGAGLWLTLAAVAVVLIGIGLASQMGYMPWSGPSKSPDLGDTTSAAPQASPAMADSGSGSKAPAGDTAAPSGQQAPPVQQESPTAAPAAAAPASAVSPSASTTTGAAISSSAASTPAPATTGSTPPAAPSSRAASSSVVASLPAGQDAGRSARTGQRSTPADALARASGRSASNAAIAPRAQEAPRAALPENPPVLFQCAGAPEICASVRSQVDQALARNNLPAVRNPDRAAIIVTANASVLQERVNRDFGTAFATRTYSVDLTGETREGDVVAMPPARTFSFDAQFGRDRLDENARAIADDLAEKVRAFWKKRLQQ